MLTVLYLPEFGQELADPSAICPSSLKLPSVCYLTYSRKFMVLKDHANDGEEKVTVVIGPILGDYFHSDLLRQKVIPKHKVFGGGYVEFSTQVGPTTELIWSAKFHGESGDYGVFDPIILGNSQRKAITNALKMSVSFEWKSYENYTIRI